MMKFMVTWSLKPEQYKDATARFLQTGGAPPEGVKMLGRWHGAGMGFTVAEADNLRGIYEWTAAWGDLLQFVITPVLEDAEAAEIFKKTG